MLLVLYCFDRFRSGEAFQCWLEEACYPAGVDVFAPFMG